MLQWICEVCGYIHDDDDPPESCPVCEAPSGKFREYVDRDSLLLGDEDEYNHDEREDAYDDYEN